MSDKLSGSNTQAYLGVEAISPPDFVIVKRDPTVNDYKNYTISTIWLNKVSLYLYMLVDKKFGIATWKRLDMISNGLDGQVLIGGGVDPVWNYITSPLNTLSFGYGANTLSMDVSGSIANRYDTDVGFAVPLVNVLQVIGGTNINTAGAGNIVTVHLDDSVLLAGSLTAGTGIVVTAGGIESTGQTQLHDLSRGVVQSSATGVLSSNEGTDGQLLISSSAGAPLWNNITSSDGSVTVTNGNNSIDLVVVEPESKVSFSAYLSTDKLDVTGDNTTYKIIFDTVSFDIGGNYNAATGEFTVPVNGKYIFFANAALKSPATGGIQATIKINQNGVITYGGSVFPTANQVANFYGADNVITYTVRVFLDLTIGDVISVTMESNAGNKLDDIIAISGTGAKYTYFSGYLLYE